MSHQIEPLAALIVEDDPWLLCMMEVALEKIQAGHLSQAKAPKLPWR